MVLIICVLISAGFVFYAVKKGFYETWALTFNLVVSVYVAIFLSPTILEMVSGNEFAYKTGVVLFGVAFLIFVVLHLTSFTFLTGQFRITLPKIIDWVGSGAAGVVAGIVVWSFFGFLILTLPMSSEGLEKQNGLIHELDVYVRPCLSKICGVVDTVMLSGKKETQSTDELLGYFLRGDGIYGLMGDEDGEEEIEAYESVFETVDDN